MNTQVTGEHAEVFSRLAHINPHRIELGLTRVRRVLEALKLDFGSALILEAAGTNGKGSSCALIDAAARASGLKSCLYTSPHLHRVTERFVINGREVTEAELAGALEEVEKARGEIELTYFEFLTLAGFYLFAKARPDLLVLEIGLGGRLDAVNVLDADVALIASVGLDHMHILGSTVAQIAGEKAGIIKPGKVCVCGLLTPEAREVIEKRAAECGSTLYLEGRDFAAAAVKDGESFALKSAEGVYADLPYPRVPFICAPSSLKALLELKKLGLKLTDAGVKEALRTACLPGRMQLAARHPDIYLDVAHNQPAAEHLVSVLRRRQTNGRRLAVIGMLKDKDIESVLNVLYPLFDRFYLCSLHGERGESALRLKQALEGLVPETAVSCFEQVAEGMAAALKAASPADEIVVLGSFVTAGEADDFLTSGAFKGGAA